VIGKIRFSEEQIQISVRHPSAVILFLSGHSDSVSLVSSESVRVRTRMRLPSYVDKQSRKHFAALRVDLGDLVPYSRVPCGKKTKTKRFVLAVSKSATGGRALHGMSWQPSSTCRIGSRPVPRT
jgi:hypothetical protein